MIRNYLELTKPRITAMILFSTGVGFWFGVPHGIRVAGEMARLVNTLIGTGLLASGTAALNQWYERESDARMRRTAGRPIPSGRVSPAAGFAFGASVSTIGFAELALAVNPISAYLGLLTLLTYLLLYTPLKQRSSICTTVGAIPGAMPPIIGFAAAHGGLTPGAWALGAILFLWQFPHFYAIARIYGEDYARAEIRMLPVVEPDCRSTNRRTVLFALALIPVSLIPSLIGMTSSVYAVGAAGLGAWYLVSALRAVAGNTQAQARQILLTSVAYLPLLYLLMLADRTA
jgi:protoheme IX farnesyltransferase